MANRRRLIENKRPLKVFLSEHLIDRLDFLAYDPTTGERKYGFLTAFIEAAAKHYLLETARKKGYMDLNEAQQMLLDMRAKAIVGTATKEELREAVARLRDGRMSVVGQATKKPKAVKAPPQAVDLDSLLT